ncbi:isoprenylcysteine carboxylmethyltransferase family protein [Clostridium felsineum]|nr:isoprenylcysteine carboxylmethyltransferase family protein [Clostridium felsineum]
MWLVLFVPALTIRFWQAWIFWCGFAIITFFITVYFTNKNPEFLKRRTKTKESKVSEKPPSILKLYYMGFILPGVDFHFNISREPVWLVIVSNIVAFMAYIFIFYVFKENSYASTVIQVEKKQQVISSGPYSMVRHPMYLGMVIISLFIPLALGSYISILPMFFIIPITTFRIKNEEKVLLRELGGYKDYCSKVRYRLIPLVW